jgi:Domain of unknown function (DUF1905)
VSDLTFEFTAPLWLWSGKGAWHFVTVPEEISGQIKMLTQRRGFGSVRVNVVVSEHTWRTSLFPDSKSGCYLLPIKAEVRKATKIAVGNHLSITLNIDLEL